ncbi:uncharacterized protein LY89DRAFT_656902 [Mollisia scopiformis]|uniref:Zn(2)-C6 fungal-type domain-containing protein n=1 Tax=Mollisia scopiformis TaxID=149040 RepID=A0A132BED8_MOLSC|nr:uncharacterized protein LY89DRAFT_656902 [Mollisia scopiformis]KUJ10214.1 hypothetical protein LY89DRAFT_656902 [Mollisia scopiformis]
MSLHNSSQKSVARRNGKLQACEPCRTRKIRCDHGSPSCGRCVKRRQEAQCYYHPAPLTKTSDKPDPSFTPQAPGRHTLTSSPPAAGSIPPSPAPRTSWRHASTLTPSTTSTPAAPTTSTVGERRASVEEFGYLGSTSFSGIIKASKHASDDVWLGPLAQVKRTLRTPAHWHLSSDRVTTGARVLGLLPDYVALEKILEMHYAASQTVLAPWISISRATDAIIKTLRDEYPTDSQRLLLAEKIFAKTGEPLEIDEHTTVETLHESFTGANLRWEILGILFTYLALGLKSTKLNTSQSLIERQELVGDLVHASNVCVSFCDRAESQNDLLVWLLYGSTCLVTIHYGDTSYLGWRRCSELASTILAMGLHRDPSNNPNLPLFMVELRRRAFAIAYSVDKNISTFFGRPPQLAMRYCTCRPPYDLTDDEIVASTPVMVLAISRLDPAGWNTHGIIHRQTWARIKMALNTILEEVLDLSLATPPPAPDLEQSQKAQTILDKAEATWESIPSFAKYDDNCWDSGLAANDCFSHLYCLLHFTYSKFLLYRIQARHGGCSWSAVHLTASKLLSRILIFSKHRDRISGPANDAAWEFVFYGLPSAALLAIELLRQQQQNLSPSADIPRSETIRNISVFISSLEWVAKPGDGNYDICRGAKLMLEKILDAILDPQPVASTVESQQAPLDPLSWMDDVFSGGWITSWPPTYGSGIEHELMNSTSQDWLVQF